MLFPQFNKKVRVKLKKESVKIPRGIRRNLKFGKITKLKNSKKTGPRLRKAIMGLNDFSRNEALDGNKDKEAVGVPNSRGSVQTNWRFHVVRKSELSNRIETT